jgi:hypothetical protein
VALRFEHHLNSSPALKMAVTSPYGAKDESPAVVERFEDTSDVHLVDRSSHVVFNFGTPVRVRVERHRHEDATALGDERRGVALFSHGSRFKSGAGAASDRL